jgi:PHD/YefM family antitoxin component YafN of YafNO toxin-antitoxin module
MNIITSEELAKNLNTTIDDVLNNNNVVYVQKGNDLIVILNVDYYKEIMRLLYLNSAEIINKLNSLNEETTGIIF